MKINVFKKIMVTGLASAICIGGASFMNFYPTDGISPTNVYAATITDTDFSATGVIKTNVSMRKGPGTSYTRLDTLSKNTKISIVAKSSNGWYKINNSNGYAYVYSQYVSLDSSSTTPSTPSTDPNNNDTAYSATGTTKSTLNVRKGPSTKTTSIGKLAKNTKVNIVAKASNGWYKIKYNNGYGYVSNSYITIGSNSDTSSKTGVVNHAVYVRKGASTKYAKLGTLYKNKKVTIISKTSDGWYKIKYGNGYGYVYGSYVNA